MGVLTLLSPLVARIHREEEAALLKRPRWWVRWRERVAFRIAPWVFPLYREAVMRERERLFQAHIDSHRRILEDSKK